MESKRLCWRLEASQIQRMRFGQQMCVCVLESLGLAAILGAGGREGNHVLVAARDVWKANHFGGHLRPGSWRQRFWICAGDLTPSILGQEFWKPSRCAGDLGLGNLRAGVLESKETIGVVHSTYFT